MPDNKRNIVYWDEREARRVIAPCAKLRGGLMEALHALQHAFGYVPEESYNLLAESFNLSRTEVYGVKSYYHDFMSTPAGDHVIQICQAESCQAMGSRALTRHVMEKLGIKLGQTTLDGNITLEAVYCLGNCALSPNISVDGRIQGRMDAARATKLLDEVAQ